MYLQYFNCILQKILKKCLFYIVTKKNACVVLSLLSSLVIGLVIHNKINDNQYKNRSKSILEEISKLSNKNAEMEKLIYSMIWNLPTIHSKTQRIPSIEYENLRRQLTNTVKEFWNFIRNHTKEYINQIDKNQNEVKNSLDRILSIGVQHKRHLRNSLNNLSMVDGYSRWRIEESRNLNNLIQTRLHNMQNPKDCNKAKKILGHLEELNCGFGCSFHHIISTILIAYDLNRTLVLNNTNWIYGLDGWKSFFEPISESCVSWENNDVINWPANKSAQVVHVSRVQYWELFPSFLPLAVPSDIQHRLERLHGNPNAWWIGQIATYLFKLNNITKTLINEYKNKLGYKKPIVGVHIRRTDKHKVAKFYDLKDYMDEVDEYYNEVVGNTTEKRKVYLATEEVTVIDEAKKNYSHYEILTNDINFIKGTRYNTNSLKGVLIDIYLLSNADFLVCTFTSNVCRLAYELMQFKYPDASDRFKSLDSFYRYDLMDEPFTHIATDSYMSIDPTHLELNSKDKVFKTINYWNGYSLGTNLRTKKEGVFPSFKAKVFARSHNYSNYDKIN